MLTVDDNYQGEKLVLAPFMTTECKNKREVL